MPQKPKPRDIFQEVEEVEQLVVNTRKDLAALKTHIDDRFDQIMDILQPEPATDIKIELPPPTAKPNT